MGRSIDKWLSSNLASKVPAIPFDESSHIFRKRCTRCEIDQRLQPMDIGERNGHITGLHWEKIGDRSLAQHPLKRLDKSHEADRLMVADIV